MATVVSASRGPRPGEAALGVFVMMAPGEELAGPFPAELQQDLVFTGAVAAGTNEADAEQAFIADPKSPRPPRSSKAKDMTPG